MELDIYLLLFLSQHDGRGSYMHFLLFMPPSRRGDAHPRNPEGLRSSDDALGRRGFLCIGTEHI
jgi:hypothetical protein